MEENDTSTSSAQLFNETFTDSITRSSSPTSEISTSARSDIEIYDNPTSKKAKFGQKGGSTSNLISHLSNIHGIMKDGPKLSEHDDIDSEFKIHEILLSLTYVKYSHTANTIQEKLEDIISDWGLTEKMIKKTLTYLRAKMDVLTQWNSSFLTWECLLLIKNAINIVLTTLTVSTASEVYKDARRLKQIQLTEDDGSEYVTISYMFPSILALMQKLASSTSSYDEELDDEINFKTDDLAFDEDVGYVDAQEEE
ncbi:3887_t:CDS:2 [Cetraspora pellucida]|uniref:3887_t:CDS:1 n=1 Tax=Cetraspora pellucida TaxID=1433469 RepID=A0ACA9MRX6_9GLOM|nr:3887_t:CDS:2 [Cetraspora pellucida]